MVEVPEHRTPTPAEVLAKGVVDAAKVVASIPSEPAAEPQAAKENGKGRAQRVIPAAL